MAQIVVYVHTDEASGLMALRTSAVVVSVRRLTIA
jgi:hypothetical protein